jgi:hypothetical protein
MKAILTKYLPCTNKRGSRIKASDECGNSITISYSHELSGEEVHRAAADELMKKMNWAGRLVCGSLKNNYVFVIVRDYDKIEDIYKHEEAGK